MNLNQGETATIQVLILDILNKSKREHAISELSKLRESIPELAKLLWSTPGIIISLLHEIISIYPNLSSSSLSSQASTRVCNVLALFQCIASQEPIKHEFIASNMPLYLYPFLNTASKARPFEYLRLTSLGVIGALVKNDNPIIIDYLLSSEIVPLCLKIMEDGNELSRTVAIFILQKILLDNIGLKYICQTNDRLSAVVFILKIMADQMLELRSVRLVKHIIRCFLRLTDDDIALTFIKSNLPNSIASGAIFDLCDDSAALKYSSDLKARLNIVV